MKSVQITPEMENLSRVILDKMTKRHYPSIGALSLISGLKKEGHKEKDIIGALALMGSGGLIEIENPKEKSVHLKSFRLLDEDGEPIKHTMIDSFENSSTFGAIYIDSRDNFKKAIECYDHLQDQLEAKTSQAVQDCRKCFDSYAQNICIDHNQSLPFCEKCQKQAKIFKHTAKVLGSEKVVNEILKIHNARYWGN